MRVTGGNGLSIRRFWVRIPGAYAEMRTPRCGETSETMSRVIVDVDVRWIRWAAMAFVLSSMMGLRFLALVDPALEYRDCFGWPGAVARHAAVPQLIDDGFSMCGHVGV